MSFKSKTTKEVEKETKQEKKAKNTMNKKHIIEAIKTWTIVVLIGLIAIAATYLIAFNNGAQAERAKFEEIKQAAKAITAKAETASLKQ